MKRDVEEALKTLGRAFADQLSERVVKATTGSHQPPPGGIPRSPADPGPPGGFVASSGTALKFFREIAPVLGLGDQNTWAELDAKIRRLVIAYTQTRDELITFRDDPITKTRFPPIDEL